MSIFVAYAALGLMAVTPIYMGSYSALPKPKKEKKTTKSEEYESDSETEEVAEVLSSEDAKMFPIYGSITLFSMYLVFKFLNKEYVNYLITAYFAIMGCTAVTSFSATLFKTVTKLKLPSYHIHLTKQAKELYHLRFSNIHIGAFIGSFLLTIYYVATKNWIASNIYGIAFAMSAIRLINLDSFRTGLILLGGLFFYDIFWVFGTEVMVSVAVNFDAPIKVTFPRSVFELFTAAAPKFTMLGLGDIVIPGIFVALCLRFDHALALERASAKKDVPKEYLKIKDYPTPYFNACFIAYVVGLLTTFVVMHTFQAAQPALLYLSPACGLAPVILAVKNGELKKLFEYKTEVEKEPEDKGKSKETSAESSAQKE
ncbi:peptidase A22B, signal peptide peptidase [Basidiobolus meristosporus CBS 931.73]|uniref:Peptidase A22B, signal peptide peptidase n=1 Tax=Basidiobolus meristosporus CBS 931.73 TaxID=1314790 RepID=A0A1Y1Z4D4_9FUNG|nr:peptidase A22B, signal peptide peptidase [Basidiobolus meristosporus CBS 931.73]|eukprot:ORY05123.1 peptidase A22B, signal peptide peptidase [Basidiobolus meristosporus CBS 931.73]